MTASANLVSVLYSNMHIYQRDHYRTLTTLSAITYFCLSHLQYHYSLCSVGGIVLPSTWYGLLFLGQTDVHYGNDIRYSTSHQQSQCDIHSFKFHRSQRNFAVDANLCTVVRSCLFMIQGHLPRERRGDTNTVNTFLLIHFKYSLIPFSYV